MGNLVEAPCCQCERNKDTGIVTITSMGQPAELTCPPVSDKNEQILIDSTGSLSLHAQRDAPAVSTRTSQSDAPSTPRTPASDINLPPLQDGWKRMVSKRTGETYYYNTETGESTFFAPKLVWERVVSKSTGETYYYNTETGESTFCEPSLVRSDGPDMSVLPQGWVQMTSRSSGKVYYWNATLQKSQFVPPVASDL